jgi:antitoxin (DNA-binding transcriptional repressor) of toxin-antitoxin stability system
MPALAVNSTDFSRNLSEHLNQVQYRGQVLDISRGKKVIARVVPVAANEGLLVSEFDAWFATLPRLDKEECDLWLADLADQRLEKISHDDPWDI